MSYDPYPFRSWYAALMLGRVERTNPDVPSMFEKALDAASISQLHNARYQLSRKPQHYGFAAVRSERVMGQIDARYAEVRVARERRWTEADSS